MKLFGPLHISLLVAIASVAAALPFLCRRGWAPLRGARLTIGWALAVNELIWWVYRYSHEGIRAANLPLQLCDLTVWLAVTSCLTLAPTVVEFAYFAGIAGAGMALLTPDLWSPWPSYPAIYFFLAHGGIVIAVALVVFGGCARFRPGAVWRSFGLLLCYAALVGAVDAALGADYMFLCRKPDQPSLLDWMGPWPWYLAGGAAVTLAFFWLLWLPVRWSARLDYTGKGVVDERT
ncbi:MAG: TIGR02206 family membrane protein [Bryobacteraceae bacterium]